VEPGESERQTLIREMEEELGVVAEPVEKIWESVTPWKVEIAWWSAKLAPAARLRPNPEEVAAVYWLAPEELQCREELLESNREFLAYLKGVERTQSDAR
jgi:8-oxo-dGTP pyrophosphatase MutT (NUDIX family)